MKKILFLFIFVLTAAAYAQIGLRLTCSNGNGKFMKYEPIELSILVRNETVNTFSFNGNDDIAGGRIYLKVQHESKWAKNSAKSDVNLAQNLVLGGGEQKELTGINLNSICIDNLSKQGDYTITAIISHSRLGHNIESLPLKITVEEGIPIKTIKMGLPAANPTDPIKSIDATLLLLDELPERLWILRVEDEKNVYAVKRLGPYIQGDEPQIAFDGYTLHILLQVRANIYSYICYTVQGTTLCHPTQKYYVSSNGLSPSLDRSAGFMKLINARPATEGIEFAPLPKQ